MVHLLLLRLGVAREERERLSPESFGEEREEGTFPPAEVSRAPSTEGRPSAVDNAERSSAVTQGRPYESERS